MQDRNDMLDILNAKVGQLDDLLKEPMPAKATSRTIAILPDQGDVVQLRGLDFVVRYVNKRTGKIHLELRVAEQRDGADLAQHDVAELCDCSEPFPKNGYCKFCGVHARYATS